MKNKLAFGFIAFCLLGPWVLAQKRDEDSTDYYKKWMGQDVKYIISDEEKDVFLKLSTEEERDQFIEQFWFRRDPDPRTSINEYKEEHYRRIAFVNEKYGSGIPGWKTDRGRMYIALGPPDIIEDHPSGGWYYRPAHEGGGATSTYPFQIWIYNYVEGIGDDVEIEFVDPSWSGEYRMALEPWEKDALLHAGFMGATDAEIEGSLSKLDRPYFNPGNYRNTHMQALLGLRMKDKPFEKMVRYHQLFKAPPIQYNDLKQLVTAEISYQQIPFEMSHEYLIVDDQWVIAPVTIELQNRHLEFRPVEGHPDILAGEVRIYGVIQGLNGRIVQEFEDTLALEFPTAQKAIRLGRKSVFQKMLLLAPGRYKLILALRDPNSGHTATLEKGIILPRRSSAGLDASSVILARTLQYQKEPPDKLTPFLLGDFKVIPNVTRTFNNGDNMGLYLQVYNAAVDSSTSSSDVEVEYQIVKDGKIVQSYLDPKRNSILDYGDRLVLLQAFDLQRLQPGQYVLRVQITDQIGQHELERNVDFTVTG